MRARPHGFVKCKARMHLSASSARASVTKAKPFPSPVSLSRGISTSATVPCLPKRSRSSLSPVPLSRFFTKTQAPPATPRPTVLSEIALAISAAVFAGRDSAPTTAKGGEGLEGDSALATGASPVNSASSSSASLPTLGSDEVRLVPKRPSKLGRPASVLLIPPKPPLALLSGVGAASPAAPRRLSGTGLLPSSPKLSIPPAIPFSEAASRVGPRDGTGDAVRSVLVQEPPPAVAVRTPRHLSLDNAASSASLSDGGRPLISERCSASLTLAITSRAWSRRKRNMRNDVAGVILCFARNDSNSGSRSDAGANSRALEDAAAAPLGSGSGGGGPSGGGGCAPRSSSPREGAGGRPATELKPVRGDTIGRPLARPGGVAAPGGPGGGACPGPNGPSGFPKGGGASPAGAALVAMLATAAAAASLRIAAALRRRLRFRRVLEEVALVLLLPLLL
mmetsp:Transcript_42143/g.80614  ORF Transcript_42143/g.80614 Transcript_42143/m.80614 type:complete len:451 (+) Transcript_42143:1213-2565(+)